MSKLPFMKLYTSDFFGDARVRAMPAEVKGIYLLLLATMWDDGGWISADDKVIARRLGVDVRVWRSRFKPEIVPLLSDISVPLVGRSFTQNRLQRELTKAHDLRAKRIANLGLSEAEYEAKRAVAPTKPVKQKRAQDAAPGRASKLARDKAASHSPAIAQNSEDTSYPVTGRAAGQTERSGPSPHIVDAAALPPRATADDEPPPENPALQKKLIADGLKAGKPPSLSDLVRELTRGDDNANRKG